MSKQLRVKTLAEQMVLVTKTSRSVFELMTLVAVDDKALTLDARVTIDGATFCCVPYCADVESSKTPAA